jgi:metal-sulfur cluster biosynthetic enzyme
MELSNEKIKEEVIEMIKTIFDPEIPVNIYDLGLDIRNKRIARASRRGRHDAHIA